AVLADARARLEALAEWTPEAITAELQAVSEAQGVGMGKVAQPMRVAITGTQVSPDIGHTVYLAGRGGARAGSDPASRKIPAARVGGRAPPSSWNGQRRHRSQAPRPRRRRLRRRGRGRVQGARAAADPDPQLRAGADRRCRPSPQGLRPA